jgi:hypothetical protein
MRATLMPPRVVTRCLAAQFFGQPHSVNACRDVERWVQANVTICARLGAGSADVSIVR